MPRVGDSGALGVRNRISECLPENGLSQPPFSPSSQPPGAGRALWFTAHVHLIVSVLWKLLFSLSLCPLISLLLTPLLGSSEDSSSAKDYAISLSDPLWGECFWEHQPRLCQDRGAPSLSLLFVNGHFKQAAARTAGRIMIPVEQGISYS